MSVFKILGVVGIIGLAITISLNMFAFLSLGKASAVFLSAKWLTAWLPSYIVWVTITIVAVAGACVRTAPPKVGM